MPVETVERAARPQADVIHRSGQEHGPLSIYVRVDEEKKVVERTRTKRQTESARRRVKRGLPPQRQPGEGRSQDGDNDDDDRFDGMEV